MKLVQIIESQPQSKSGAHHLTDEIRAAIIAAEKDGTLTRVQSPYNRLTVENAVNNARVAFVDPDIIAIPCDRAGASLKLIF